jgi:hypothetical protein
MAHTACLVCFISTVNDYCNKKRKEKKKLTLGRLALVAGTQQTLSNLFWRLSISMAPPHIRHLCVEEIYTRFIIFDCVDKRKYIKIPIMILATRQLYHKTLEDNDKLCNAISLSICHCLSLSPQSNQYGKG